MSFEEFLLIALALLTVTFAGLGIARRLRARRDAVMAEAAPGWVFHSELSFPAPDPYYRFRDLRMNPPVDVLEGTDEGFQVSYFEVRHEDGRQPGALVQLPVEGPSFEAEGGEDPPAGVGPRTAEVLGEIGPMVAQAQPFAVFVQSRGAPQQAVHRAALRLARAIVADSEMPHQIPAQPDARNRRGH